MCKLFFYLKPYINLVQYICERRNSQPVGCTRGRAYWGGIGVGVNATYQFEVRMMAKNYKIIPVWEDRWDIKFKPCMADNFQDFH